MDIKEITTVIEEKFDDTKDSIENRVERIVGKKRFHAEIFWGILGGIVLVALIGGIALFTWRTEVQTIITSQFEVMKSKQEQTQEVLSEKIDTLKEKVSEIKDSKD